jgi:hypothetical protein
MRLERELLTEEVNVFCVQLLGTAKWQAYVQILQIWMLYTIKELPLTQSWPCTHGLLSSTQQVQALLLAVASATVRLQHTIHQACLQVLSSSLEQVLNL